MSDRVLSFLKGAARLAPALFGIALLYYLLSNSDWDEMQQALGRANLGLLSVAVLLGIATIALGVTRWQVLLRVFGVNIPFLPLTRLVLEGTAINVLIPGGLAGDIARAIGIREQVNHAGDAASSVITDRLMGLLGFVMFALVALALRWSDLNGAAVALPILVLCCLLFVIVALSYSGRLLSLIVLLLKYVPIVRNIADLLAQGLLSHRADSRTLALAFAYTLAAHFMQILTTWAIGLSLGIEVGLTTFALYVPIVALLAAIPISHFGMGLREGGFVLMLGISGVSSEFALLLSVLFSIIAIFLPAFVGSVIILSRLIRTGRLIERA